MEQKDNRLVDVSRSRRGSIKCWNWGQRRVLQFIGHRSMVTTVNPYWHINVEALQQRLTFPWAAPK